MEKVCKTYGVSRLIEDFPFENKAEGKRNCVCNVCHSEYIKRNAKRDKKKNKERHSRWRANETSKRKMQSTSLKSRKGITLDKFDEMVQKQDLLCLACKRPMAVGDYFNSVVDHDHSCCPGGKSCGECIRGIIHRKCNTAIGMLDDDPLLLRLMADYLETYNANKYRRNK